MNEEVCAICGSKERENLGNKICIACVEEQEKEWKLNGRREAKKEFIERFEECIEQRDHDMAWIRYDEFKQKIEKMI